MTSITRDIVFRSVLGRNQFNILGYNQYTPHGSSGTAILQPPIPYVKDTRTASDCFSVSSTEEQCFSLSVSESECFAINTVEYEEQPILEELDLSYLGITAVYSVHAMGINSLYAIVEYETDVIPLDNYLVELVYVDNGTGLTGINSVVRTLRIGSFGMSSPAGAVLTGYGNVNETNIAIVTFNKTYFIEVFPSLTYTGFANIDVVSSSSNVQPTFISEDEFITKTTYTQPPLDLGCPDGTEYYDNTFHIVSDMTGTWDVSDHPYRGYTPEFVNSTDKLSSLGMGAFEGMYYFIQGNVNVPSYTSSRASLIMKDAVPIEICFGADDMTVMHSDNTWLILNDALEWFTNSWLVGVRSKDGRCHFKQITDIVGKSQDNGITIEHDFEEGTSMHGATLVFYSSVACNGTSTIYQKGISTI